MSNKLEEAAKAEGFSRARNSRGEAVMRRTFKTFEEALASTNKVLAAVEERETAA